MILAMVLYVLKSTSIIQMYLIAMIAMFLTLYDVLPK